MSERGATDKPNISGSGLAVMGAVALALFYLLRQILLPFVLAAGLAYILNPLIVWLEARARVGRRAWAVLLYLVLLAGLGMLLFRLTRFLTSETPAPIHNPEEMLHDLLRRLFAGEQINLLGHAFDAGTVARQTLLVLQRVIATPMDAAKIASASLAALFGAFLTLVLLFYFLVSGNSLIRGALELAPPRHRPWLRSLAARVHPILARYVRGLFLVVLYGAVVAWLGLGPIFHLPHALVLALATGVLELVPAIGPAASAILLGSAAVLHGGTAWTFAGFAGFCLALRLSIDQFVGPLVLGRAVTLHPVVIIFAFLSGGALFGVIGVLLAVPAAAALKIILRACYASPPETA